MFKGTKVSVSKVLDALRRGCSISEVLAWHPGLTRPAVEEALGLAIWALVGPYDYDALIDPQELVDKYGVNPDDVLPLRDESLTERVEIGRYLVSDPKIHHGQVTFKGTRVMVRISLNKLRRCESVDDVLRGWPSITRPAVQEAISLAMSALIQRLEKKPARLQKGRGTRHAVAAKAEVVA
jgi:uncharacterized protein (DUF433 family)